MSFLRNCPPRCWTSGRVTLLLMTEGIEPSDKTDETLCTSLDAEVYPGKTPGYLAGCLSHSRGQLCHLFTESVSRVRPRRPSFTSRKPTTKKARSNSAFTQSVPTAGPSLGQPGVIREKLFVAVWRISRSAVTVGDRFTSIGSPRAVACYPNQRASETHSKPPPLSGRILRWC